MIATRNFNKSFYGCFFQHRVLISNDWLGSMVFCLDEEAFIEHYFSDKILYCFYSTAYGFDPVLNKTSHCSFL